LIDADRVLDAVLSLILIDLVSRRMWVLDCYVWQRPYLLSPPWLQRRDRAWKQRVTKKNSRKMAQGRVF
jgi:hypothetical protein